jgi:hypothetical protein
MRRFYVPAAELEALVAGRGGLAVVLGAVEGAERERLAKVFYRARRDRRLTLVAADRFCTRLLGLPASAVWGPDQLMPARLNGHRPGILSRSDA